MKVKPRIAANLVVVFVLAAVMVGWALSRLVFTGGLSGPFKVVADFSSSGGVFTNQEVTYRGVLVGKVGELTLSEDGVDIELLIDRDWEDRIPAEVVAKVQSKSAVGEQFVNLTPVEGAGDATLADGDVIHRDQTELPVDFQRLLTSLDRVLSQVSPERTARVISNLAGGLGGRADEIGLTIESLGTLADAFAEVAPEQRRLLDNATTAGAEFVRTKDAFADAIRAADEVLAGIGDEPDELRRLFAANDLVSREGISLLARRGDQLQAGISALADFVSFQLREKESLVQSLTYVPQFLHAVEDASVPWSSPDGREFYRIRIGLISDNVPSSWPCKYEVPPDYERFPHERKARGASTGMRCIPAAGDEETAAALVSALRTWAEENPPVIELDSEIPVVELPPGTFFSWPLVGPITSGFGPRDGRLHAGIDIDGEPGDVVVTAREGTVVHAGDYFGYGTTVVIDHGDGMVTLYAHLSALGVSTGDAVVAGQAIGAVGCTGSCTGDHLHFEIRIDGVPVDPLPYLPGSPLFVTLPTSE